MRSWRRVPTDTLCGYCRHRTIPKGEAALYRKLPGVKREQVRCQECAREAPPDLPPLMEKMFEPIGFSRVTRVLPERTRGALKALVADEKPRDEWMPYRDE